MQLGAPGKARVDRSAPAFTALTRGALWFLAKASNVAQTVKELNKAHKAFKSAHGGGWRVWNDPSLSGNHTLGARLARKYLEDFVVNGDDQHDAVFRPTLAFLQRDEASTPAAGNSARRSIDMTVAIALHLSGLQKSEFHINRMPGEGGLRRWGAPAVPFRVCR